MKNFFSVLFAIILFIPTTYAQSAETWDEYGERISESAERLGRRAEPLGRQLEYKLERGADRFLIAFERFGNRLEQRWGNDPLIRNEERTRSSGHEEVQGVFLGIESVELSTAKAEKLGYDNLYGSYVSKVFSNSAAADAGLQPFDYLFGVNDLRTSESRKLSDILNENHPGDLVTLHFSRKGKTLSKEVRLGSYENYKFEGVTDRNRAMLGVSPASDEKEIDLDGVTVTVLKSSAAERMGLKNGDVVTSINGFPVLDWDDIVTAISNINSGDRAEITVDRNGKDMNFSGELDATRGDIATQEILIERERSPERVENREDIRVYYSSGAFLGIYTSIVSKEKARILGFDNPYGTYVTGIVRNSSAEKAGIQAFDYIYGIDEYRVGEAQGLTSILRKFKTGDKADVLIIRKGQKRVIPVTFISQSNTRSSTRNSCDDPFLGIVQASGDKTDGVRISPVKNSTAENLGLRKGDVILYINDYRMVDWTDITTAIDMLKPGQTIYVEYERNGRTSKASKPIMSYAEAHNCRNCDCNELDNVLIDIGNRITEEIERIGDSRGRSSRSEVRRSDLSVGDVTNDEGGFLKSKGIDISSPTLKVENLNLESNSSNGKFSVKFHLPSSGNTTVQFYNSSGRVVYDYALGEFSGDFSDEVDLAQNGPGNYYLLIKQSGKAFSKMINLK